jgi:hypothetical protein
MTTKPSTTDHESLRAATICEAATSGNHELLRSMLASEPVNDLGWILREASSAGHAQCVGALLPYCMDPLERSFALRKAIAGGHTSCVNTMLAHGVDPADYCSAALMDALNTNQHGLVRLLAPLSDIGELVSVMLAQYRTEFDVLAEFMSIDQLRHALRITKEALGYNPLPLIRQRLGVCETE